MKNKIQICLTLCLAIPQGGCVARRAQLANFESGEIIQAKFTDTPFTNGKISVIMPDGEELKGEYSAIRGQDSVTFSSASFSGSSDANAQTAFLGQTNGQVGRVPFSTTSIGGIGTAAHVDSSAYASGRSRTIGGTGRAYAILSSTKPGSKLMMEVLVDYGVLSGHGWGEARTNTGRNYRVTF